MNTYHRLYFLLWLYFLFAAAFASLNILNTIKLLKERDIVILKFVYHPLLSFSSNKDTL